MLNWLLNLDRYYRAAIIASLDICLVPLALWLSFSLRLGEWYQPAGGQWLLFAAAPLIAIPVFIRMGLYRAVLRYIGHRAMLTIAYANGLVALVWSLVPFYLPRFIDIDVFSPRSLPFIFWMVLCVTIGGSRQIGRWVLAARVLTSRKPILIYGAGDAGAQLANSLSRSAEVRMLGFIDDDAKLHGRQVAGLSVLGDWQLIAALKDKHPNLEVLLALPSASRADRLQILERLEQVEVAVRTMPPLDDIALGRADLTALYEIDMADLLGRAEIPPSQALLHRCIQGKTVLVSGAGGTIGSELCRQVLELEPERLILLEHSEFQLFSIDEELRRRCVDKGAGTGSQVQAQVKIVPILGTVLDRNLIANLIQTYGIQTIYHAAAYKHVPLVEHNILAGVRNNVVGTYNLAVEAMIHGVERFVLVSTDKAVRPTNVMGASKRAAEMVLQGLQSSPDNQGTTFSMVRFGNVLGSSGSVIPQFKKQIMQGGPVTVTHPEITRYFMTIHEAASLVIQAGSMGQGGDVFVLDMGEPVKIAELARRMVRLSGFQVQTSDAGSGIAIEFTGLRDGEKLYEELLIGDNVQGTDHPLIMVANEQRPTAQDIGRWIADLDAELRAQHVVAVRDFLLREVEGFQPQCGLEDTLWMAMEARSLGYARDDKVG